jgi:hypothetical protein
MAKNKLPLELPPDVKAADLKYPSYERDDRLSYSELQAMGLESNALLFYRVTTFGWVLTTLLIGKGRNARSARYYAVKLDGTTCRVGQGPHVTKEVTVYLTKSNLARLQKYVDLYQTGGSRAGEIRDRISSRRAEGQERRARGERFWHWSN